MWITRRISDFISDNQDLVQILTGPRQVGKTSLLEEISSSYDFISLDDPSARQIAQDDPEMFLNQFGDKKLVIDEAQYAPNLFPSIKKRADALKKKMSKKQNHFRLTGSNQILMDRAVKEGLTGRASYFTLNTLSFFELADKLNTNPIDFLYQGGWPELYAYPETKVEKYLNDYITSYIEKDIILSAGIQKSSQFIKCLGLLAGRSGQVLNYSELAKLVGVDTNTIVEWVSILERMKIISLVNPFSTNLSKRLIKASKIYFLDTGLACRLQGWTSAKPILTSPQAGPLFETLVYSELYKYITYHQKNWKIYHWRTRDGEEVDFILQVDNQKYIAIEAKVSPQNFKEEKLPQFSKVFSKNNLLASYICHLSGDQIWGDKVPFHKLESILKM